MEEFTDALRLVNSENRFFFVLPSAGGCEVSFHQRTENCT